MPRTTTIECPGCPSLRALTFDTLGLIKGDEFLHTLFLFHRFYHFAFAYFSGFCSGSVWFVLLVLEAREKQDGVLKVVDRWGEPEASKSVLAVSMIDQKSHPVCFVLVKWY